MMSLRNKDSMEIRRLRIAQRHGPEDLPRSDVDHRNAGRLSHGRVRDGGRRIRPPQRDVRAIGSG